jgi:hypothetical protein
MRAPAAKRPSRLAELDIESEGLTQQDGLAERLARQRGRAGEGAEDAAARPSAPARDANAWRRGKSLLQVAIDEDTHVELSIIAKRRRLTLSQLTKDALNDWLKAHGHELKITS